MLKYKRLPKVILDGKPINYRSVEIGSQDGGRCFLPRLEIKIVLMDGQVIHDNGERVEVIFNTDN